MNNLLETQNCLFGQTHSLKIWLKFKYVHFGKTLTLFNVVESFFNNQITKLELFKNNFTSQEVWESNTFT